MAGTPGPAGPVPRFESFDCSGVLYQNLIPTQVGPTNLTDCNNIIYHRQGGWGKRSGATRIALPAGPHPEQHLVNGFRWYRVYPTVETRLLVWAQGQLLIGTDEQDLHPLNNSVIGAITNTHKIAPDFCAARDPQANKGNAGDICIIAGLTSATGSFGIGAITITGLPSSDVTGTISVTVTDADGHASTTSNYTVLPTDDPASIADELCTMINNLAAFLNQEDTAGYEPFINEAYYTAPAPKQTPGQNQADQQQAIIHLGARHGGAAGNNITYTLTTNLTNAGSLAFYMGSPPNEITVPVVGSGTLNFHSGGGPWSGPMKVEIDSNGDAKINGLSFMCPNDFTGCCSWHDHVWLWADSDNPDTAFASDIYQPEAFTFMEQNGGMTGPNNGGYNIGPGDGDPGVKDLVPNGNLLGVWKTANIYAISGYDFQPGEYQFAVSPVVVGYGAPSRDCVDVLDGQWVWWSGKKLLRLAVGAFEPEHIGLPVPLLEGTAGEGDQKLVKVAAGDFQVKTSLTNDYAPGDNAKASKLTLMRSVTFFAVDVGSGSANTIYLYDDEKTALSGGYAWAPWHGWTVGCWIKYGIGENPAKTGTDPPVLRFVVPDGTYIVNVGDDPLEDWGNPIAWMTQTGWIDFGTPELIKNIHEFYLRVAANKGAVFHVKAIPARIVLPYAEETQFSHEPIDFDYVPTLAPTNGEALNDLKQFIQASLQTQAVMLRYTEDGTAKAGFELLSYGIDVNPQEAYGP